MSEADATRMLNFPNPSRSYDVTRNGVRFWGYDRTFEVAFFVEKDALSKMDPGMREDEVGFLNTFDVNRDRMFEVASYIYSQRRKASHIFSFTLTDADF